MRLRKYVAGLALCGGIGVPWSTVFAQEAPEGVDVQAVLRRLEAAEAEIRMLKSQAANKQAARGDDAPLLIDIAPAGLREANDDSLGGRLSDLEKKFKAAEEAEAKKKAEFPTYKFRGRVDADTVTFDQNAANKATVGDIQDGADFRRARIGVEGLLTDTIAYVLEMDFAGSGRPTFTDVFATITDLPILGNLRIGHFKEFYSLEQLTSSRFTTFMERSMMDEAFVPARNLGIGAFNTYCDEAGTWAIGAFKTASDDFGDEVGDGNEAAVTGRLTYLPYYDTGSDGRYLVHIGGAYSFRDADQNSVTLAAHPEIRMRTSATAIGGSGEGSLPNFVTTGAIPAEHSQLLGAEAAVVWGSLSVQAEYTADFVDPIAGDEATFHGFYIFASYFLTGESRPYNRKVGYFDRVKPLENAFCVCTDEGMCKGWGAWEARARYSRIDLSDSGINGGEMNEYTLGLTWYLNANFKILADYIHSDLDRGANGGNCDIFAMRAHFDW
jgi:phosphate-selective porin OprO/OprP